MKITGPRPHFTPEDFADNPDKRTPEHNDTEYGPCPVPVTEQEDRAMIDFITSV
jgi:hypothetical protein